MIIGVNVACASGFAFMVTNEEAPFSINKSRQIRQIQRGDITQVIGFQFWQNFTFVKATYILNESLFKVTLNDLTMGPFIGMRKSELCGNTERKIRRVFPAEKNRSVGKAKPKVTECLNESARLLAQNMAQTMDEVTRDVLASTSSILQCSNGSNGNTPTEITKEDIDAAVVTLLGNDAEMISEVVTGTNAFGTSPIRPAFWGYMDTALLDDLEAVSNFVNTSNYSHQATVLDAEWGSTGNVRWLYTSVGSVSSAATAVYNNFIVGKESYALVHLRSETGEFYVEPLGSAGSADPLHQRGSVGWQHPFVARILNDAFMLNLMSTHS